MSTLLEHLAKVHSTYLQTYTDLLNAVSLFAAHQQYITVDVLLKQPLPYSVYVVGQWHS